MTSGHQWTEIGKELLANISAMIAKSGHRITLAHEIVLENPMIFRKHTDHSAALKHFHHKENYVRSIDGGYFWVRDEILLLDSIKDKPVHDVQKLFPNRTKSAIWNQRCKMKKGLIKLPV